MSAPTADPVAPDPVETAAQRRAWPAVAARVLAATGGGVLLYLSFPPRTPWWLALPALALLGAAVHGRRARAGFGYGFLFGLAFMVPLLSWVSSLVETLPWIALSVLQALFVGLAGAAMALVSRLPVTPLWGAAVWIAGEALRGRVPWGGLPWGRVGFGQVEGPLLPLAAIGGEPLLSFATVLAGLALGDVVRRLVLRRRAAAARPVLPAVLLVLALVAGPLAALVPASAGGPDRTVTIAAVQGNVPRLGLDFNTQRRAVLDNHVRATIQLADAVAAGTTPKPDLVIWPENSSDIDPLRNADAAAQIDRAARAIGTPILVGAVLRNPDGLTTSNSALVWEAGRGVVERNDKRRVQPFGEYIPWREFFALFSPYVERGGYFVPGDGSGVVDMAGVRVGIAICWEIAFDDLVADSVAAGAEVLAVPSNNATFGLTEMTYQQLAMSQVRAVEHDRSVIVATTSGVSATITPDGAVTASTPQFTPDVLVDRTTLRDTTTLATRWRSVPEWVLVALGLMAVGAGVTTRPRARTRAGKDEDG